MTTQPDYDSFAVAMTASPTQCHRRGVAGGAVELAMPGAAVLHNPTGLAVHGNYAYVANTSSNTVSVINTATGQRIDANPSITSMDIAVGSSPSALAVSPMASGCMWPTPAAAPCR